MISNRRVPVSIQGNCSTALRCKAVSSYAFTHIAVRTFLTRGGCTNLFGISSIQMVIVRPKVAVKWDGICNFVGIYETRDAF